MIDSRPRPEYGEYATPAEQAEAMGITVEELAAVRAPKAAPGKADGKPDGKPDTTPARKTKDTVPASTETTAPALAPPRAEDAIPLPPPAPATPRRWDRAVSLALVFFGVYLVFGSIGSFRQFGTAMAETTKQLGYGEFTLIAMADSFGFWLSIIEPVILVITVGITLIRLRSGKLAFYIPIIGAVVGGVIFFIFFAVLWFSDPALAASMQSRQ